MFSQRTCQDCAANNSAAHQVSAKVKGKSREDIALIGSMLADLGLIGPGMGNGESGNAAATGPGGAGGAGTGKAKKNKKKKQVSWQVVDLDSLLLRQSESVTANKNPPFGSWSKILQNVLCRYVRCLRMPICQLRSVSCAVTMLLLIC